MAHFRAWSALSASSAAGPRRFHEFRATFGNPVLKIGQPGVIAAADEQPSAKACHEDKTGQSQGGDNSPQQSLPFIASANILGKDRNYELLFFAEPRRHSDLIGTGGHRRPRDRSDQRSSRSRDRNSDLSIARVGWFAPSEGGFVSRPRRQTIDLRADHAFEKLARALGQFKRSEDETRRREHDVDRASRKQRSRFRGKLIDNPTFVNSQRRAVSTFRCLRARVHDEKRAVHLFNEFEFDGYVGASRREAPSPQRRRRARSKRGYGAKPRRSRTVLMRTASDHRNRPANIASHRVRRPGPYRFGL